MKINLLTLFLVLAVLSAHCQDRIIKNDKTEIKSKIEEITETTTVLTKFL